MLWILYFPESIRNISEWEDNLHMKLLNSHNDPLANMCIFYPLVLIYFIFSLRGFGNVYRCATGDKSWLDVFLLFCWDIHVLLCTLADICLWNNALWNVSNVAERNILLSYLSFYSCKMKPYINNFNCLSLLFKFHAN